ncbi:3 beta-hydroxysteroid dehydrogenase type 7-like [Cyanistes caeruleus]|uniref:3 beta-hydroxysteroid dehydrogenase type 7-like n=1 Tax=Cyanistes caeruleus TaxID=156563 RepID=UPI000CDA8197|nr:3 beta-hydroxysteroid dehydrogenase type 7-like [Cyanistes caeruleus]
MISRQNLKILGQNLKILGQKLKILGQIWPILAVPGRIFSGIFPEIPKIPGIPAEFCLFQGLVMVVTGGSGFLGSHLVQVLLEAEPELRELRILDVNPDPEIVPERHRSRVRFFHGDVADFGALGAVFGGARVVFHSASLVDVWGNCSPEAIARVNVLDRSKLV